MAFNFPFNAQILGQCINNREVHLWVDPLVNILDGFQINTAPRVAAWLAQTGHESGDFKLLNENLNYGAKGLRGIFRKYFPTDELANAYQRHPEKIASRVYGGRMGNGDEASMDGWKFHGRGLIQVTGKSNYAACSKALFGDDRLLEHPDLLATPDGAIRSACWFWDSRHLNHYADIGDMDKITHIINGGTIGAEDRNARYHRALKAFGLS